MKRLSRVLAQAFHEDPVQRWIFREEREFARGSHRVFGGLMRGIVGRGGVFTTDAHEGAALWDEPGFEPSAWTRLVLAAVTLASVGPSHALNVGRGIERLAANRPRDPHWYLGVLGTHPDCRGRGVGAALLQPALERCDREGAPAYLESSRPENIPFYERQGFAVTGEFTLGDGPPVWPMLRPPR